MYDDINDKFIERFIPSMNLNSANQTKVINYLKNIFVNSTPSNNNSVKLVDNCIRVFSEYIGI